MENPPTLSDSTPLGVFSDSEKVFLYHTLPNEKFFQADISTEGFSFSSQASNAKIVDEKRRNVNPHKCFDFRISRANNKFYLTYKYKKERQFTLYGATSKDLIRWQRVCKIDDIREAGMVVPNFQHDGHHVMYFGERDIKVAFSKDLLEWSTQTETVLGLHEDFFGTWPIKIASIGDSEEGILLLYYVFKDNFQYAIHAAILDKNDPKKVVRTIHEPIWESPSDWPGKQAVPLGVVILHDVYISYWLSETDGIFAIPHPSISKLAQPKRGIPAFFLHKFKDNPIIKPIADHFWESRATFNPGAIYEKGKVHLVYRAIGDQDVSVLGYASSEDGINFERLDEPAYIPTEPFECSSPFAKGGVAAPFASGGGCYGGCEDPRITKIDDTLFMTYVAYDGWSPPRVALTSISMEDFIAHKWRWKRPVLLSRPGVVNKNACILPEKIDGKYVVFHRIFPNILVDYVDDLDFDGKTRWLRGDAKIAPRPRYWDSRKVGVGAPPIKTDDGWLLIYQAVGDQDSARYKMGAMLLDLKDPTHVLHRSVKPILEPTEWYENEGYKAGVAYPCGAVAIKNKLHVYYGGADMVTCAATAPLDQFIDHLKTTEEATLVPMTAQAITH